MPKTYFRATLKDGRTVIRGSADDYGYCWAYPIYGRVSFTKDRGNIPADKLAEAVPVDKLEPREARAMLKDGRATGTDSKTGWKREG